MERRWIAVRKVIKHRGNQVRAYELGCHSQMEQDMIRSGKIILRPDGEYELFSRESINGSGEIAAPGDFFKIDSDGFPYPNSRKFFFENHRHISGDLYEQKPRLLEAWEKSDAMCPEIEFLIKHKGLTLDENNAHRFFTAPLWGTVESAARDAVIIFYETTRNAQGDITDAVFNFVAREEFERTYEWVRE